MEMAHRVSTGIFFAGGLRSALGRTSCSGPRTQFFASWERIHFDKNGDRQYIIWKVDGHYRGKEVDGHVLKTDVV